ncbi:S9 family peptidase [Pelomonas sp. V22]|uniref:alpha/beta hydrolase family protein n=1 Tax=Pelomonas sp. V22 TaxID=2822139 RepID=UPI0024A83558|nr:prolyl oligopeptidase family serine peptidase [Pelomonas sp. V22]MDI4631667.1 S9 family peptidase [Pelomonas sp. V22]
MLKRRTLIEAGLGLAASTAPLVVRAATEAESGRLPLESFARRPMMEQLALSPDGKLLAAIVNEGKQSMIVTRAVDGGAFVGVLGTDNLEFTINWLAWANPTRLLVSLGFYTIREERGYGRIETTETRLVAIDADGKNMVNLVRPRGSQSANLRWAWQQDNVVDLLPDDPEHILMALPGSSEDPYPAVMKVNVYTASRTTHATSRDRNWNWITDAQHRVRIGIGNTRDGETTISVCDTDGNNWRQLSKTAAFEGQALTPLGFGLDPQQLYVTTRHEGLEAVFTLDLGDPKAKPVLKLANERYDLGGSLVRDARGEAVGVSMRTMDGSSGFFWDPTYKENQTVLDAALPDRANGFNGRDRAGSLFIVRSAAMGEPEQFFLARFGDQPSLKLLANSYPELKGQPLGRRQSFRMKARDGLPLHGYLTFPPQSSGGPLPLVVLPHGGPQSADHAGFDDWSSFIADRGHLVLQLNYRGSTGYGQKHLEAGLRRWGLEMQEDLEDGVAELVKLGRADPKRVAIVGGSYGGYAALMGVIKTPELYRGAFAFAPVTDLVELTKDARRFGRREVIRRQVGDASDDRERLEATSPCLHAKRIKVPVVIAHGTVDRSVEFDQSVRMVAALKEAGKPHEFIKLERGDHFLSHQPYRQQVLAAMERFLDQVLPKA